MKSRLKTTAICILLIVVCAILCGCGVLFNAPLGKVEIPNTNHGNAIQHRIYVCGAVEREGYYDVDAGTAYAKVLRIAGLLPQSVMPSLSSAFVDGSITEILVPYFDGEKVCQCINVNSIYIVARLPIDGLSASVVDKLASYVETHGKFTNKQQVLAVLGNDYAENFYKLYIAAIDYETN